MTFETFLFFGGADFVGINFIKNILKSNGLIIVFDKLTKFQMTKVLKMSSNNEFIFINDDICNTREVFKCLEQFQPNYIINFAAETHVDNSIEESLNLYKQIF